MSPLYDLDATLARLGGDMTLFHKLAGFFCEDSPPLLNRIEESLAKDDAAGVHYAAHSLKGLAATFSAAETEDAARQIEELGRIAELGQARVAFDALKERVEALCKELSRYVDSPSIGCKDADSA